MGRNKKGIQESQNVKGSMNGGAGRNFRTMVLNFALWCEISHCGVKFSASSFFASAPSFSASAPSFLAFALQC